MKFLYITWTQTYLKFESLSHGNCTKNPKPLKTEVPEGLLSHLEAANGSQPPPYHVDRLLVAMQSENPRMSFLSRTKVWYCAGQHQRDFWGLYSLTLQIATVLHTLQAAMRDRRDIHSHRNCWRACQEGSDLWLGCSVLVALAAYLLLFAALVTPCESWETPKDLCPLCVCPLGQCCSCWTRGKTRNWVLLLQGTLRNVAFIAGRVWSNVGKCSRDDQTICPAG